MTTAVGHASLLKPAKQPLWPYMGCATFLHLAAGGMLGISTILGSLCSPREPIIKESIQVSMVVLPKSETNVPDRAQRAAVQRGSEEPAPAPEPVVTESDLAIKEDKPEPKPGREASRDRDQMMAELERQRLLDELTNAADGAYDRDATDPNSESDVAINAAGSGNRGDPEFAAYVAKVQQLFMKHFKPLAAITAGKPNLVCTMRLTVDPATGEITSSVVDKPSGIPAYDAAAERAVQNVGTLPLPPEKYLALVAEGYTVNFRPP